MVVVDVARGGVYFVREALKVNGGGRDLLAIGGVVGVQDDNVGGEVDRGAIFVQNGDLGFIRVSEKNERLARWREVTREGGSRGW